MWKKSSFLACIIQFPKVMKQLQSQGKLRLSIVICGMSFNGFIYGFPSPALPSFNQTTQKVDNIFDELFTKVGTCITNFQGVPLIVFSIHFSDFIHFSDLTLTLDQTFYSTYTYWIQILCLVLHCMVFNLGYGCLGYPMVAELFPPKLRSKGVSFHMVLSGFFGFLNNS